MKYTIIIYPHKDSVLMRYASIEADGKYVIYNDIISLVKIYDVIATQYIKVWVSAIEGMERYVEIFKNGVRVAEGEVHRDKPLVYNIAPTPIQVQPVPTPVKTYTWTQEFKMRAETGGGWAPFVLEKELVVSLKPYFEDNTISIDKAVLKFTLVESNLSAPELRSVKIYCNGIKIYDKEVTVYPNGFSDSIEIPTGYLAPLTQFRVEYSAPRIFTWFFGLKFEGTLQVTFTKMLTQEEQQNPQLIQQKINEYTKQSVINTVEAQGNMVKSVEVEGNTVKIIYETPQGETKTDWWGTFTGFLQHLPNIILAIIILFILIELIRVFRH